MQSEGAACARRAQVAYQCLGCVHAGTAWGGYGWVYLEIDTKKKVFPKVLLCLRTGVLWSGEPWFESWPPRSFNVTCQGSQSQPNVTLTH